MDIVLSLAIGASFMLACSHTAGEQSVLRSPALWTLLAFETLFFLPAGAYLLWRYPDWSFMYLFEPPLLGGRDWTLAGLYPASALAGFALARVFLARQRPIGAVLLVAGSLLVAVAIASFGHRQLFGVGTTAAFRADSSGLPPLGSTPLAWIQVALMVGMLVSWVMSLWRLHLYNRAWRAAGAPGESSDAAMRERSKSGNRVGTRKPEQVS
jgi:hypothetical protein